MMKLPASPKLGLQLYTVRDEVEKDILGTIRLVGKMGYEGIEFAGGARSKAAPYEINNVVSEVGLEIAGAVFTLDELETDFQGVLNFSLEIHSQAVILPWIPLPRRSVEGYVSIAQACNAWGKQSGEAGISFLYHVHGYEFTPVGGKTVIELLADEFDPRYVNLETDVYWVEVGGADSVQFMRHYGARSPYIHFKDMKDKTTHEDAEVGDGVLDMKTIAQIGYANRARWFIVEQEQFTKPTLESAQISCRNLRQIISQTISGG
jgi:sugar phosphate isomerase/epimerase